MNELLSRLMKGCSVDSSLKILDCTLRDGGYYNNWDFDLDLVDEYLKAIHVSGVSHVELGLRNFPKEDYSGPFAYTPDAFIKSLNLPPDLTYGVMIDAKTILESSMPVTKAVDSLFLPARESPISLVRIAAHFREVAGARLVAEHLSNLGYVVGFNLMQAVGKTLEDLASAAAEIESWGAVDVLYFADSLGNMDADEVHRIAKCLRRHWSGEMGIHTHDNMTRGLDNSLNAINAGVTWLDSTVTGMGRGAGNTATEHLLSTIEMPNGPFDLKPLYELIISRFEPLKSKYGWGSNLLYFLGAKNNVHPTYIQNLSADHSLDKIAIVNALDFLLMSHGTNKYDGKVLEAALKLRGESTAHSGQDISNIFSERSVLIVTNAQSVANHKQAIELYVAQSKPVVISINVNSTLSPKLIDVTAVTHNLKYLTERQTYAHLNSKILLPLHRFSSDEKYELRDSNLIDYGLNVIEGTFSAENTFCCIPSELTLAYAVAAAIAGGATKIEIAGIDGYEFNDNRNVLLAEFFGLLKADIPVIAVTPTNYQIAKSSIYATI